MRYSFHVVISCFLFISTLFASDSLFTKQELEYIKKNPHVKIAMLNNFKPFSFVENEQHIGMSKDILSKISDISGLEFDIELSRWTEALNKFKNKEVDMISGISHTQEREAFSLFSEPFYEIPTYLFGLKDTDEYKGLESLKNKKVGVSKSLFYINKLKSYGIEVVELKGSVEKVEQMVLGNIDYFLASYTSGTKAIKKAAITSIKPISEFTSIKKEDLRFGVIKEKPLLYSIIQKSMAYITRQEFDYIVNQWIMNLDIEDQSSNENYELFLNFTEQEKAYINNKSSITMCVNPYGMPFESYKDGIHKGIANDYKNIFEKKLSIPFKIIKSDSWEESLIYAKQKRCEILSFIAMKTKQREEYLSFTTPYLHSPFVIATRNNINFIADISLLDGKKFAIPKGYASADTIKEKYPKLKILFVKNAEEGLQHVIEGKVFGYIGALGTVGHVIQNQYLGELKIAGKFNEEWKLSIASQKDDPILHSILQKTLDSITISQRADIYNRWVAVKYEQKVDYKKIWQIIFFALFAIIIVLYWNRKLEHLNKELKKQQKITKQALMVKSNFLANISHEIRTPMNSIVNMSYLAKELSQNKKQKEYIEKIELAANTLLQLINNVLDISKIDAGKTNIVKSEFFLESVKKNIESISLAKAMENNIDFEIVIDENVPNCLVGDSLRIEQVLINLVSNGIKFTENGKVTLHISKVDEDKYHFCVNDTGIGMDSRQLKKIFKPFTQADDTTTRNYGGTGLGLTISKELVELMGGKLSVTSEVNKGSSFCFTLHLKEFIKKDKKLFEKRFESLEYNNYINNKHNNKAIIQYEYEKELLEKLKIAVEAKRPNICKPLLEELEQCKLQTIDIKKFEMIKGFIHRYKFNEAWELLDE